MSITSDDDTRVLFDAETIVVVSCPATTGKPAHDIPAYMQCHGCRVVPVNPFHDEILGEAAYNLLADVGKDVDLVDVFRPSEEVGDITNATIEHATDRGDAEAVWLQLGIRDGSTAVCVEEAGLSFVQDKRPKVEHSRLA